MSGAIGVVLCSCIFVGDGESAPEGINASSAHWSVVGGGAWLAVAVVFVVAGVAFGGAVVVGVVVGVVAVGGVASAWPWCSS